MPPKDDGEVLSALYRQHIRIRETHEVRKLQQSALQFRNTEHRLEVGVQDIKELCDGGRGTKVDMNRTATQQRDRLTP